MSDTYQGIDLIFKEMMNPPQKNSYEMSPILLNQVAEKGLKGIITEGYSRDQSSIISLKISHLLGYLTTITTWDSLSRFMQDFNARTRFREVNFDSFIEEFEQRFGQNIKGYMDEWYTSRQIPLLSIKDLSRKTTKEMQIIDFKVGNFNETDGIVSIISQGGSQTIQYCRSYIVKPGECKRIIVHEDIEKDLRLTTNFSGCFPKDFSFNNDESPLSGSVPKEGVTLISRNQFYPPWEIIVDNEDENFQLIDSANNRKRLADLIQKEDNRPRIVGEARINVKTNAWSSSLSQEFYGGHIRSAFTKTAGTGNFKAEWTANLPEAGTYEIFIHRPHIVNFGEEGSTTDYPGMKNYFTVYPPKGKEEIILEIPEGTSSWSIVTSTLPEEEVWVSLGTFTLPAGESRVMLDDRGVDPISVERYRSTFSQLIVADAIKWVKKK